ncbi:MAG TPA: hypothetical protein VHU61_01995 [Solirubrobacteraceae bacterium]|jgi:hypothetical protein|nr:hypothetical protein [Solirubrobacteraceae bacterium]
MPRIIVVIALLASAALTAPAVASASSGLPAGWHECQHPVVTGVEVYRLKSVKVGTACAVALALSKWEPKHKNASRLYGCHRKNADSAGYPYLKLHVFDGWKLSLTGRYGAFTMSQGAASFEVTGTDFPLNCS